MIVQIPVLGAYDFAAAIAPLADTVALGVSPRDVMAFIVWIVACRHYIDLMLRFLGFQGVAVVSGS